MSKSTDDEFWILIQRLIAFEEPSSRSAQIKKTLAKHLKTDGATRDISKFSAEELDNAFNKYFGPPITASYDLSNALISTLLALEYVGRFSELSFAHWYRQWPKLLSMQSTNVDKRLERFEPLKEWITSIGLVQEAMHWVLYNSHAVPDWRRLTKEGPWQGDARAEFLADFIKKLDERGWGDITDVLGRAPGTRQLWLVQRDFRESLKKCRELLPASFLPNGIILVEGQTEVILLPHFARCMSVSFEKMGAMVMPAGGANQVVRRYLYMRETIALPIICLLDGDSPEHGLTVDENLREIDRLFILSVEEIEDAFELPVFIDCINGYLQTLLEPTAPLTVADVNVKSNRSGAVTQLLSERGLPPFNKLAFAKTIAQNLRSVDEVPVQLRHVVRAVQTVLAHR